MPAIRYGFYLLLGIGAAAVAGEADVTNVSIECDSGRTCTLKVTVRHADAGWDHYTDHWRVLSPDGNELGRRILHHPHVSEQPFSRSLSGIHIPAEIGEVTVEAHDSVHQYGGRRVTAAVTIPGQPPPGE
jgi:hypothetical protein